MREFEGEIFIPVETAIGQLIEAVRETSEEMWMELNGVILVASPADTLADDAVNLTWAFWIAFEHPEILARDHVRVPKVVAMQQEVELLYTELSDLNVSDVKAATEWLIRLQLPSLHTDVRVPSGPIRDRFRAGGWLLHPVLADPGDREALARQVIGSALGSLRCRRDIFQLWRNDALACLKMYT